MILRWKRRGNVGRRQDKSTKKAPVFRSLSHFALLERLLSVRSPLSRLGTHPLSFRVTLELGPPGVKMTFYSYPITIEKEGKQYYAYSEDFSGVYGLGKTIEEAKKSILKAMRLYIEHCRKTRKPIPPTRTVYAETVTLALD